MCLLFESIRMLNGQLCNLSYHQHRMDQSRRLLFGSTDRIELNRLEIPFSCHEGLFKCRLVYARQIESIEFEAYLPRSINSLKLVEDNQLSYEYKYSDRNQINRLTALKADCDDILIVKNGLLTDTSFSNIVFFDGQQWFTPTLPLMHGTMWSFLLDKKIILPKMIPFETIQHYSKVRLINAMLPFESAMDIPIDNIIF